MERLRRLPDYLAKKWLKATTGYSDEAIENLFEASDNIEAEIHQRKDTLMREGSFKKKI